MRDCAAEAMGTLMKIIGERAMNPYMEGLDDIRKTKIKEFFETAQVKAKEKPKPVAPPPAAKGPPRKLGAKPGLKAPAKKVVPPPAVAPVEEPVPAKPAARGIPSKLAPKGALGASRLQKKGPTSGGSSAAPMVSPKRALPREYEEEEPAPAAPPSRLGLGRGLAGRPLSKDTHMPTVPARADPQIAADRNELEELRNEREKWERQAKEDKAEKSRLLQEINDLQLQVRYPFFLLFFILTCNRMHNSLKNIPVTTSQSVPKKPSWSALAQMLNPHKKRYRNRNVK